MKPLNSSLTVGILLWSLGLIIEGRDLLGGLVFALLVNMKQLYAVLGPLYFVYLLRHYCRSDPPTVFDCKKPHWISSEASIISHL